jgi:hypothetical protein
MMVLVRPGVLDPRIKEDPRWSTAQQEAALKAARTDPTAKVVGLDAKLRPVLLVRVHRGRRSTQYALLRNGSPAKPERPLAERYTNDSIPGGNS